MQSSCLSLLLLSEMLATYSVFSLNLTIPQILHCSLNISSYYIFFRTIHLNKHHQDIFLTRLHACCLPAACYMHYTCYYNVYNMTAVTCMLYPHALHMTITFMLQANMHVRASRVVHDFGCSQAGFGSP